MEITRSFVSERDRALLGGDYANYHAQAARRIHTLRKRLGTATPRGRKYTPKSPVTVQNVIQDAQWVQLLLASAERAWADAMAMKSLQSPENTQKPMAGSTKKQIVSRHRRAISYAMNLVEVLSDDTSKATPIDKLEAQAYLAQLKGGLEFEKSHWKSCIQNYATARLIYVALDTNTKSDLYKDLLSNTIDPSIKYAAYQSKLPRTKAVGDIAIESFPATETSMKAEIQKLDSEAFMTTTDRAASEFSDATTDLPSTINWRSRKVKIEDAGVSQALGVSQDKENALSTIYRSYRKGDISDKELANAYEDVIDARQEAVDVTKTTIDELRSQGVDQSDTRVQSLQVTRTAVNYAVIEWRIGRNRVLCGKDDGLTFGLEASKRSSKLRSDDQLKPEKEESTGRRLARLRERVTLYDSILQSLDAIKELPGVAADAELMKDVENRKGYFRALKCTAIGRSHALNGNIVSALALFSRANDLAKVSTSSSASEKDDSPTKLDVTLAQVQLVQEHLVGLTMQYQALVELKGLSSTKTSKEGVFPPPLIERFHLNRYDDDIDPKNLVNYPPKLQAIPVKPLFFDLAWNYIQYPREKQIAVDSVVEKSQEVKTEEKPVKKGWFGFGR